MLNVFDPHGLGSWSQLRDNDVTMGSDVMAMMRDIWCSSGEDGVIGCVKMILPTVPIHAVMVMLTNINRFPNPPGVSVIIIIQNGGIFPVNYMIILDGMVCYS